MARANYRQTCVDLRDGILQDAWHQNNQHLHLCGVGLTGIAQRDDMSDYDIMELQRVATHEAMKMADEFALMKREYWVDNPQRAQSNNSLRFDRKPSREELRDTFQLMMDGGGCEPGFINGVEARRRAPWFSGSNPLTKHSGCKIH